MNISVAVGAPYASNAAARVPTTHVGWALRASARLWFGIAVLGQLFFAVYVGVFYGRAAASGHPELWNKVLQVGYVPGDTIGNLVLASHLLFGALVTAAGVLQVIPVARRRWPSVHRWNGRFFVCAAALAALGGLVMIWTRPAGGDMSQHVAISINALIILGCAGLAWRNARSRRFDSHREWALRLWLAANGGWFFRIGLMAWIVANRGPVGFDPKTFTGPFITFLSFAQYLLPLAVLQGYLLAQRRGALVQAAMSSALALLALVTLGGVAAAAALLWIPHLGSAL